MSPLGPGRADPGAVRYLRWRRPRWEPRARPRPGGPLVDPAPPGIARQRAVIAGPGSARVTAAAAPGNRQAGASTATPPAGWSGHGWRCRAARPGPPDSERTARVPALSRGHRTRVSAGRSITRTVCRG